MDIKSGDVSTLDISSVTIEQIESGDIESSLSRVKQEAEKQQSGLSTSVKIAEKSVTGKSEAMDMMGQKAKFGKPGYFTVKKSVVDNTQILAKRKQLEEIKRQVSLKLADLDQEKKDPLANADRLDAAMRTGHDGAEKLVSDGLGSMSSEKKNGEKMKTVMSKYMAGHNGGTPSAA